MTYVAELPQHVQARIVLDAEAYLQTLGLDNMTILETIENILCGKLADVLNEDGTFIN